MADPVSTAGLGQCFICSACARVFSDRAATSPVAVTVPGATVQREVKVPHAKYPNDPDLASTGFADELADVSIAARAAASCCAANTRLCSATHVRYLVNADGTFEIVGAEHLE